jgi:hypothetical protein
MRKSFAIALLVLLLVVALLTSVAPASSQQPSHGTDAEKEAVIGDEFARLERELTSASDALGIHR